MPITRSAKKALRSSARKHVFNLRRSREMKRITSGIHKLLTAGKVSEAKSMLPQAYKAIDKAAKRGIIKANTAARKKSRLSSVLKKTGTK